MTEGNGHVIDPRGDAHRALQAAVAEHGPQVLSDPAAMAGVCHEQLGALPSEAALIGIAAQSDVPELLHEQISQLGNYGGIQSVAGTLADSHGLDRAAALWVVREYARALGLIASGGGRPPRRVSESRAPADAEPGFADPGLAGAGLAGAGLAGAGLAGAGLAGTELAGTELAGAGLAGAGLDEAAASGAEGAEANTVLNRVPEVASDHGEAGPGDTVLGEAASAQPGPGDTVLSEVPPHGTVPGEAAPSDTALGEQALGEQALGEPEPYPPVPGETALDRVVRNEDPYGEDSPGDTVLDAVADGEPGPGGTVISRVPSGPAAYEEAPYDEAPYDEAPSAEAPYEETPYEEAPYEEAPPAEAPHSATMLSEAAGGMAAAGMAAGSRAPESGGAPASEAAPDDEPGWIGAQRWTSEPSAGAWAPADDRPAGNQGTEQPGTWRPAGGNAAYGGYQQGAPPPGPAGGGPGYPPGPPGGGYPVPQPLPYATPKSNRNRNLLGIAAAVVLVAVYLGIAAVVHLTPFATKTTAAASTPPPSQKAGTGSSSSASTSTSATASATPTSPTEALMAKIPASIAGTNNCKNLGAADGATARLQCTGFQGPATGAIYYLYSDANALSQGFDSFLSSAKFTKERGCTTDGKFVDFVVQCEDTFTNRSPAAAGRIAEYQRVDDFDPIIVSTDTPQLVMTVLVGTSNDTLLSYWKQFGWIKS